MTFKIRYAACRVFCWLIKSIARTYYFEFFAMFLSYFFSKFEAILCFSFFIEMGALFFTTSALRKWILLPFMLFSCSSLRSLAAHATFFGNHNTFLRYSTVFLSFGILFELLFQPDTSSCIACRLQRFSGCVFSCNFFAFQHCSCSEFWQCIIAALCR